MSLKYLFDVKGPRARLLWPAGQTAKSRDRLSGEHPTVTNAFIYYEGGCHSLY